MSHRTEEPYIIHYDYQRIIGLQLTQFIIMGSSWYDCRQTDGRTRGRVRAGPSFQLGTLSTRTKWWRATHRIF